MESVSSEVFDILRFLLPGFLTAWIFHAFTSYPKPSQFERIVQALIFTVFVQMATYLVKNTLLKIGIYFSVGPWTENIELVWSYLLAGIIGFIFTCCANIDCFHTLLRNLKITKQTSYHCEWFGAFQERDDKWVILHLSDDRRIYGWPYEWPSDPTKGHFVLMHPSWISDNKYIDLNGVESIMFKVSDIKWVEFIAPPEEV